MTQPSVDCAHIASIALRRKARVVLAVSAREPIHARARAEASFHLAEAMLAAPNRVTRVVLAASAAVAIVAVALSVPALALVTTLLDDWVLAWVWPNVAR